MASKKDFNETMYTYDSQTAISQDEYSKTASAAQEQGAGDEGEYGEDVVKQVSKEEREEQEKNKTEDKGAVGNALGSAKDEMIENAKQKNPINKLKAKLKEEIKESAESDPYTRHHVLKNLAEGKSDTNPGIAEAKKRFESHKARKDEIYKRSKAMGDNESLSDLMRDKRQMKSEDLKETVDSVSLKTKILADTAKNVASGPLGCLKEIWQGIKGVFGATCISFFIGGGATLCVIFARIFG